MKIAIIGAGPAGLLAACLLKKLNCSVKIYEKRDRLLETIEEGRSINLALSVRALSALDKIDLVDDVIKHSVAMNGRMIHLKNGSYFQAYSHNTAQCLYSISRTDLIRLLLKKYSQICEEPIQFNVKCLRINTDAKELTLQTSQGITKETYQYLIGADGLNSVVRKHIMQNSNSELWYRQIDCSYIELILSVQQSQLLNLKLNAFHLWPRQKGMLIALPNKDNSFSCTLFWDSQQLKQLNITNQFHELFATHFSEIVKIFPNISNALETRSINSLSTLKCTPWHSNDSILLGDAAHAVVPFYGQGVNAALEDCVLFADVLEKESFDWNNTCKKFAETRKQDTDTLADLAMQHYSEMSDKVRSKLFYIKKKISLILQRICCNLFLTDYALVTFTTKPYSLATKRKQRIKNIMNKLFFVIIVGIIGEILWIILPTFN